MSTAVRWTRRTLRKAVEPGVHRLSKRWIPDYERLGRLTPIACSRQDPPMLFHTWDRIIGPEVLIKSSYDASEMRWALDFLGQPQRGRCVVDVGANIGTTTIPFIREHGARRVEAFEPEPSTVKLLRCNVILNELEDQVRVHPVAVSDSPGVLSMSINTYNGGDHHVAFDGEDGPRVSVPAVRLDAVDLPPDVGLFWVDAQAHEASVLEGAPRRPAAPWVMEYSPSEMIKNHTLDRLNSLLAERFSRIVDVRASMRSGQTVDVNRTDLHRYGLEMAQVAHSYTDLILLP